MYVSVYMHTNVFQRKEKNKRETATEIFMKTVKFSEKLVMKFYI